MARLTKNKFLRLDPSAIGRMKVPELRELLRGARSLYNTQEKKFSKYEDTVFSPALDKMQSYYEDKNGQAPVTRMSKARMQNEIFRLQEFFESDTSTIPGARKVMADQDRRIFGVDEKNRPLHRMTLQQRTDFWAAYNEFVNMEKESYVRGMGSNTIQQYLGQMIIESRKAKNAEPISAANFGELKRRLEEQKQLEEWETANYEHGNDSIFSGKRSN